MGRRQSGQREQLPGLTKQEHTRSLRKGPKEVLAVRGQEDLMSTPTAQLHEILPKSIFRGLVK
jgi:hypothetical protein